MLRATHSALKPGAPNCFYAITTAEDLTETGRERLAQREGNEDLEPPVPYKTMMAEAGFVDIELTDVTSQYVDTLRGLIREWEAASDALMKLVGEEEFARKIHNRTLDVASAEDGLIRRYRVYGLKPSTTGPSQL